MRMFASQCVFFVLAIMCERLLGRAPYIAYAVLALPTFIVLSSRWKVRWTWLICLLPALFHLITLLDDGYGVLFSSEVEAVGVSDAKPSARRKPIHLSDYVVENAGPSITEHYVTRTRKDQSDVTSPTNDYHRSSHTLNFDARPLRAKGQDGPSTPKVWLVCTLGHKSCQAHFDEFDGGGYLLGRERGRNERAWLSDYVGPSALASEFVLIEPRAQIAQYHADARRGWFAFFMGLLLLSAGLDGYSTWRKKRNKWAVR